jgi:hypothetical protein
MRKISSRLIYNYTRKKRKGMFKQNHPIHQRTTSFKGLKDVFLVLAGGLCGVFGNQYFYAQNRQTDADIELKKELIKAQYPYLNNIIHFTFKYAVTEKSTTRFTYDVRYVQEKNGKLTPIDSVLVKKDSAIKLPLFVNDTIEKKRFLNDINEIVSNKNYIDQRVWDRFEDVLMFLKNHPIPETETELSHSSWIQPEVQREWFDKLGFLYVFTSAVMTKFNANIPMFEIYDSIVQKTK